MAQVPGVKNFPACRKRFMSLSTHKQEKAIRGVIDAKGTFSTRIIIQVIGRKMKRLTKRQLQLRRRLAFGVFALAAALCIMIYFAVDAGSHSIILSAKGSENELVKKAVETRDFSGWVTDTNGWRYLNKDGAAVSSRWQSVEGSTYYFTPDGYMATGFQTIEGKLYSMDSVGQLTPDSWVSDSNGGLYRMNSEGYAVTGWYTDKDGRIFYFGNDGRAAVGWQDIESGHYYMGTDGAKVTGFSVIDGNTYYLGDDGIMRTGWQDIGGSRYYFGDNGIMSSGLCTIADKIFFFAADGRMVTGFTTIDGRKYSFAEDGSMQTGWVTVNNVKYYFDSDGKGFTGWHNISGTMCCFSSECAYEPGKVFTDGPMVALTFDDGPGKYTSQLLDILQANNAKATFFMIGSQVPNYADQLRREQSLGMELANHSWDHATLTKLDAAGIQNEVTSTNNAIAAITGVNPVLFRPPGGGYNDLVSANSCGMPIITWSIDTLDWKTRNAQTTYNTVMGSVKDGDIILMHEIYQESIDAAKALIPALIQQGYQLVTVSELANRRGVTLTPGTRFNHFYPQ